jgi:hypothetical protein
MVGDRPFRPVQLTHLPRPWDQGAGGAHHYLGNEHLLLALLRDGESACAEVFFRHGFADETAIAQLRAVFAGELQDVWGELKTEYLRICPDDEPDSFMQMLTVDPKRLVEELRRLPDGAGQLAVVDAFKSVARGQRAGA